ncbi:MAG: cyclic nucleotide-binding domain-containing protein [Proteobacteria bacterium]|nr:cyclic nucleotide-binding domain-containing protein [Pseudomonadota bacterium]
MKNIEVEKQLTWHIPLEQRIRYIKKHNVFCLLEQEAIIQLAFLMQEIYVSKNEIIVHQDKHYDSFYLIVSGEASVTRSLNRIQKTNPKHITNLGSNMAIGLGDAGFHNSRGIRSATVTAITPMALLKMDIFSFYEFLRRYGDTYPYLKNMCERFLLYFILKEKLFTKLSEDIKQKLIKKCKTSFDLKSPKLESSDIYEIEQVIFNSINDRNKGLDFLIEKLSIDKLYMMIIKLKTLGFNDIDLLLSPPKNHSFLNSIIRMIMSCRKGKFRRETQ